MPLLRLGFINILYVHHRNLRSRSGMHLCMQDDQNDQKTMALPSADNTRLTRFILSKKNLVANGLVWQLMVTPL
jgi:hypothetical protein